MGLIPGLVDLIGRHSTRERLEASTEVARPAEEVKRVADGMALGDEAA